ncbi:MAG: tRNA (adenosine(37)-N6)-threonylcarbamoyltransferase complex dimerization subunit type 1 TsaB [Rhodoferax sp.]
MNLLAFDTSTDLMSIAVQRTVDSTGQALAPPQVWQHTGTGGAQTSAHLIPTIQQLMAQAGLQFGQLDAIVFGCGPGSFTGLRTACAVAQGLAFGVNVPVLPVDTLLSVAEEARWQHAVALATYQVMALLDARMDEMYAGSYFYDSGVWRQIGGYSLIYPEDLVYQPGSVLAGNVFAAYGARLPGPAGAPPAPAEAGAGASAVTPRIHALPSASAMLRLAPALLAAGAAVRADQALPRYIRDKVAKTTVERAAEKAAALAT